VIANPSGSRTPPAGGQGRSMARREHAATKTPSTGLVKVVRIAGATGASEQPTLGSSGGTRHAMTVCRGAPSARRAVQGRVGDCFPRHVVDHLAPLPLLSANTSGFPDAVRPLCPGGAHLGPSAESTVEQPSSRPGAQPRGRSSPRPGARDTELVQPAAGVVKTPSRRHSRGKGVLVV
jgi:hypothetical protein